MNDPAFSQAVRLPRLNAILDDDVARRADWVIGDLARACLAGGARFLQIRAKRLASGSISLCATSDDVGASVPGHGIVNDRADLARLCGASGVHVGQEDLAPVDVRVTVGDSAVVGLSYAHERTQVRAASAQPIDYIAVGPVFGTGTKETGYAAVGLDFVRRSRARTYQRDEGRRFDSTDRRDWWHYTRPGTHGDDAGATSVAVISDLLATGIQSRGFGLPSDSRESESAGFNRVV